MGTSRRARAPIAGAGGLARGAPRGHAACQAPSRKVAVSRARPLLTLLLAACGADADRDEAVDPPKLVVSHDPEVLTDLAREAVDASPTWLQDALAVNLSRLEAEVQDEYGALLVDLDEPWILDEVAFTVAHLSPEVLASSRFHPELLVENAEMI